MDNEKLILCIKPDLETKKSQKVFPYEKKLELKDLVKINLLLNNNLKIGSEIPSDVLELDANFKYVISGASSLTGTCHKRYINCHNPVKIKVKKRKKKMRVFPTFITYNCSVLNLVAKQIVV